MDHAGLITRGLGEMTRIGIVYGASPLTFLSLAGVGDLFLTCSSSSSRNYTVGYRLGKGEKLPHIIETLGSVAEGVTTSKGLQEILDELDVSAPIAQAVRLTSHSVILKIADLHVIVAQVYDVLHGGKSIAPVFLDLLLIFMAYQAWM
jgi:glycerol-3-phosphate dehydrogenase